MIIKKNNETETEVSIAEYIINSIDEKGFLPKDFELPDEDDTEGIKFADGAMDGICMYHMGHDPLEDGDKKRLEELIMLAGKGNTEEAEKGFAEFCKEHRAITIIDELQESIMDNREELNPNVMFEFAQNLFLHSSFAECVKIGLSIFELLDIQDNEELVNAIKKVGLCDEFTVFSVFVMRKWPTAEKDILECAKHVRGWGRIHCVDYLEAEENETKEWLLFNGTDNDIMPAYSAWNVFLKADVPALLRRGNLNYEEIHAILKITEALIDEGPVRGISNMDNPKDFLNDVLLRTKGDYPFTEEDTGLIKYIQLYD